MPGASPVSPAGTILIRDKVQQDEMDKHGEEMIQLFSSRREQWKELLAGVKLRSGSNLRQRIQAGPRRRRDGAAAVVRRSPYPRR